MNKENKNVNLSNEEYIEKLENAIKDLNSYNNNLQQERDFYKNIVEELKKYANEEIIEGNKMPEEYKRYGIENYVKGRVAAYKHILSKLEELEKGNNYE